MTKKKPFTTRMDPAILELAERLAALDRRSVTAVIELALIDYAERRGLAVEKKTGNSEPGS
ncbi:toxin-antitoxin system HicB family antitoxin [Mesorhizobium sp. INR15]|uniref:toxin-antitoxin system HicB family antitoxin n=1 Tax=Mesorhizobium sp. INR15 TaxID=2654248 RepID=UPI0018966907|nr:toxin-antitoxin system HicB family antitoxin [Mesorhizobium sp. INR15]QPC94727.1 toxin-antitoxin system HicB family antitoxin [Mesorhizobium sp. INR15]